MSIPYCRPHRRPVALYGAFPMFLCLLLGTSTAFAQVPVNDNGGFEASDPGATPDSGIESWSFSGWPDLASFEVVSSPVQEGSRALKAVVSSLGSNEWSIEAINEEIQVEPNTTYRYSIWARSEPAGATANFTVGNYDFQEYGRIASSQVSLTTDWQEFTFEFTVDDRSVIRAPIHLSFQENTGQQRGGRPGTPRAIYIDNLRIFVDEVEMVPPPSTTPLAEGLPKFLGNVYSNSQIVDFEYYWTQMTPENAGKWGTVEAVRGEYKWTDLDTAYDYAKSRGMAFRFHVLVWGSQQPAWLHDLSSAEQRAAIEQWFAAVAARYPDLDYVEVVNEPMNDPPFYKNALGGDGSTKWDWVITAFELARQHFPDSKLMINEYNIISARRGTISTYRNIVQLLNTRGLIDGIGVQGHAFSTNWQAVSEMLKNLDYLAATGLPIQITEMDVDGPTDEEQLAEYQRLLPAFYEHPAVEGITLWGWKPGLWRTEQRAYTVYTNGEERPAMGWMREYMSSLRDAQSTAQVASFTESSDSVSPSGPTEFQLVGNYPNPLSTSTQIRYDVAEASPVRLVVYDVTGRTVQTLVDGDQSPGSYTVVFDASQLASGVYWYRLEAGGAVQVRSMTVVR